MESILAKEGGKILERLPKGRVSVIFETGNVEIFYIGNVIKGEFKNPMKPSLLGRGFLGKRYHKRSIFYPVWSNMMHRCYAQHLTEKYRTYSGVEVSSEWFNFSIFEDWCFSTHPDVNLIKDYQLDKDLLSGSIYSKDTCLWLPRKLNQFINCEKARPNSETGVIGVSPIKSASVTQRYEVRGAGRNGAHNVIGYTDDLEVGKEMYFNFKNKELECLATAYYNAGQIDYFIFNLLKNFKFKQ